MAEIPGAPEMVTPEERVKEREKIKDEQQKLSTMDTQQQQKLQRQQMLRNVAQNTLQNLGKPKQLVQAGMEAQKQAMQMPVQQAAQQGDVALQTLKMEGDISTAKQEQRAKTFQQLADAGIGRMALQVANRAFDLGYNSKQLALHQNAEVADLAFQKMYEDFAAGRMTQKEILTLGRKLKAEANDMKIKADEMLAEAMGEFNKYKTGYMAERAKARLLKAIEFQKEAMATAAKASNTGAILSGVFQIVGAGIGAAVTGGNPAGAIAGSKIGGTVGSVVNSQR